MPKTNKDIHYGVSVEELLAYIDFISEVEEERKEQREEPNLFGSITYEEMSKILEDKETDNMKKEDLPTIGPDKSDESPMVLQHRALTNHLNEVYAIKNKRYGNSFDESVDEWGLVAAGVRIGDKYKRMTELIKAYNEAEGYSELDTDDETLIDTLLDAANYNIMLAMYLERKNN